MAITRTRQVRARTVSKAIQSAVVINKYDLVGISSAEIYPLDYDANADGTGNFWDTDEATTQGALKDIFVGMAMERSRSGDTKSILIATDVEVYADVASATYAIGAKMRLQKASGSNVTNQSFKAATDASDALGRIVNDAPSATAAWIRLTGNLTLGGVLAAST